jgi:hypothetical protein
MCWKWNNLTRMSYNQGLGERVRLHEAVRSTTSRRFWTPHRAAIRWDLWWISEGHAPEKIQSKPLSKMLPPSLPMDRAIRPSPGLGSPMGTEQLIR